MLDVQIVELCRVRNAWYKGVREDLLSQVLFPFFFFSFFPSKYLTPQIYHYKRKSRQKISASSSKETPPLGLKTSAGVGKSSSPRIKTPTGNKKNGREEKE